MTPRVKSALLLLEWTKRFRVALSAKSDEACLLLACEITEKLLKEGESNYSNEDVIAIFGTPEYEQMNNRVGYFFDDKNNLGPHTKDAYFDKIRQLGSEEASLLHGEIK